VWRGLVIAGVRKPAQERKSGRLRSPSATQQTARGRSRAEQVTGNPWIFSGPTLPTPGVPAFQGEHNVEILSEANVPDQVIKDLQRSHILLSRRSVLGVYD
jgi:hypothetical protein